MRGSLARLERLGAKIKARLGDHVVMVAPTGHPYCVAKVYRPDFDANAVTWNDDGEPPCPTQGVDLDRA